jgi:hypothetical protein
MEYEINYFFQIVKEHQGATVRNQRAIKISPDGSYYYSPNTAAG